MRRREDERYSERNSPHFSTTIGTPSLHYLDKFARIFELFWSVLMICFLSESMIIGYFDLLYHSFHIILNHELLATTNCGRVFQCSVYLSEYSNSFRVSECHSSIDIQMICDRHDCFDLELFLPLNSKYLSNFR